MNKMVDKITLEDLTEIVKSFNKRLVNKELKIEDGVYVLTQRDLLFLLNRNPNLVFINKRSFDNFKCSTCVYLGRKECPIPDLFKLHECENIINDCEKYSNKNKYVLVDNKPVEFDKLPCAKCEWYYTIHCPHNDWCHKHKVNPYVDGSKGKWEVNIQKKK